MAWRKSKTGLFRRLILWILIVTAAGCIIFNMVFVLQTASELTLLPHKVKQPEDIIITTSSALDDKKTSDEVTSSREEKYLELEVYSSKENVTLTINGKTRVDKSEMLIRGLNVVVLNEATGAVMSSRWFDTYESKADSGILIDYLKGLRQGRIVCFAIKDDALAALTTEAKDYLATFDSSFINRLQFRSMWAFVVQRMDDKYIVHAESFQNPSKGSGEWARPLKLRTWVKLSPEEVVKCSWMNTVANRRRKKFCDIYEGYGDVCRCKDPTSIEVNPPPFLDGSRLELPIAVMASNRPHYLLRMLLGLQKVEGLEPSMLTVFIDGFWDEPASVTRLMGFKLQQHTGVSQRNARVAQHYKKSIHDSFEQHPNANYLVILEEDLDVSVDILSYFKQLLPVLENDESLYCISAWNDQGYDHLSNDPAMMYRVETMPGLGCNLVLRGCVPFGQHQQQKSQSIWSPLTENARAMERGPVSYPESAGILVDAPLTKKPEDSGYEVGRGLTQCERKRWCVGTRALVTKRLTCRVLSRKLFKNELEEKWPKPNEYVDWDMWTRLPANRKGRECIIPDISRTYHFGGKGINVGGFMQELYFEKHAINKQPHVNMDVNKMYKDNYEKEIQRLLSEAEVLDHTKTPCANKDDFVPETQDKIYVFYITMKSAHDFQTWKNVASCLRMWDLDARGFHKSMWRFWIKKNHVLVVGCPASEYCSYKPVQLTPLYIPEKPKQ